MYQTFDGGLITNGSNDTGTAFELSMRRQRPNRQDTDQPQQHIVPIGQRTLAIGIYHRIFNHVDINQNFSFTQLVLLPGQITIATHAHHQG